MSTRLSNAQSGARFIMSGRITSGATWIESISLDQDGAQISGADTSTWKMVFKRCDNGTPDLTLTSGAEITVTQNTTATVFDIEVDVSNMCGDYRADFAEQTSGGNIIHWASGTVTFVEENLGF